MLFVQFISFLFYPSLTTFFFALSNGMNNEGELDLGTCIYGGGAKERKNNNP